MQARRKNGFLEIRFNEDRTQALATIFPPAPGGEAIQVADVLERFQSMGVMYGIDQQAILEAVHHVVRTDTPIRNALVAQGVAPEHGTDARVRYTLPLETLSRPLPKRANGQVDWFALDLDKLVTADQELAVITPASAGTPGKTLTWPIQLLSAKPGKPLSLSAGPYVALTEDGLRMVAAADGCVCLHHDILTVHALRRVEEAVQGDTLEFPNGAVFLSTLTGTQVRAGGFIAVKGAVRDGRLRADGDIIVRAARDSALIAGGNVYVLEGLVNCQVISPGKILALPHARIIGGSLHAREGMEVGSLGTEDFTPTEVIVNVDRFSPLREQEIEEELADCEANKERISQALKPFTSLVTHTQLTQDKRQLLHRLQAQKRAQEERINALHNERRTLTLACKGKMSSQVRVLGTAHPGVWIGIGNAALQVETPMQQVTFVETPGGKSVQAVPFPLAA